MSLSEFQRITFSALLSVNATLAHESEAVLHLSQQFQNDLYSQINLANSLKIFFETNLKGGKIVCCGIGKSYKIATKVVATLKSLSINADILHPAEALHGDLGLLHERDCVLLFTASGNTLELIQLLPHFSQSIPVVLLTCNKVSRLSELSQIKSLLYAELPEHLKESTIHGLPAPTVSTTLSLVLADAVVLALSEMIESDELKRKKTFSMKHPGGSIGSDLSHLNDNLARVDLSTVSPSLLTQPESNSSLLSLNQVRKSFNIYSFPESTEASNASSLVSSDNEDALLLLLADSKLSAKLKSASRSLYSKFDKNEVVSWSEVDLLKNITIYDYILFENTNTTFGLESSKIRSIYKLLISESDAGKWGAMDRIVKAFHIVEF